MWICVNCGERNIGGPDECRVCSAVRIVSVWIPEPAEQPARSRILPALPIAVLVGALGLAAVIGGPRLFNSGRPRTEQAALRTAAPILETVPLALVTAHPRVDHPGAPAVVAMLDTYFRGINERDYRAVATILDPAGDIDPGVPGQLRAFAEGTSTSRDSDVVLLALTEASAGRLRAEVSFRSEQATGHGPPERPAETCTRWQAVYLLTAHGDGYRMLRGDATNRPC
ncbi:hypothetical protein Q0Z83_074070 [Actinoplanes sichuanensis]|uniref:RanBP2-type domain-containing protein n=1 Tax=Actinoplanes sichuanensis TaxID=512349 RepID=A0ABW4A866_9ACTN|nr:hypothetical protein [Actinoplanes sichuanensis]BEL09216.1 hypothetical protein Q0Z83_074070 [Actinoplanes sichuanensis]